MLRRWILMVCVVLSLSGRSQSILSSGTWHRFAIRENGLYRIGADQLRSLGIRPGNIDPKKIRMFTLPGGMLPQANDAFRYDSLQEMSIHVEGESDGKFDSKDYIVFYAEGPHRDGYNEAKGVHAQERHLYATDNYCYLTVGDQNGKRMATSPSLAGSFPVVNTYDDYTYYENNVTNILNSGRAWFGEKFGLTKSYSFNTEVPGVVANSEISIVSDVLSQSFGSATMQILMNGAVVGEHSLPVISRFRYGVKGIHALDTFRVNESALNVSRTGRITTVYQFNQSSSDDGAFLDYFLIGFKRRLALYDKRTFFFTPTNQPATTFEITNTGTSAWLLNITNPLEPVIQQFTAAAAGIQFSTSTTTQKKFIVSGTSLNSPKFDKTIANQNLAGLLTPDAIFITHNSLRSEANRLAEHRASFSNMDVAVVTTEEIFNEFSSGKPDVSAMRDFIKKLYDKNPSKLKFVLFFGKGTFDYLDRYPNNVNLVLTYESRNSTHPLQTYSSDDFFGFMDADEGEWSEDLTSEEEVDLAIGRIPVRNATEASRVVDKIIRYDENRSTGTSWQRDVVFVADDGNNEDRFTILHQFQADQLAEALENTEQGIQTRKLYAGIFPRVEQNSGDRIPALSKEIIRQFNKGALIVNYTGHGSERVWMDERVFTDVEAVALENEHLPFLVTATCEFGRNDDPTLTSTAEFILSSTTGGAIGLVTTTRPVSSTTNFTLNQGFYDALFTKENGRHLPIGEVFRRTKNNSISGVANRNFSLLGDPSMMLALPELNVVALRAETSTGSTTLKALSTVTVSGEIRDNNGAVVTGFDGQVEITVLNKELTRVTNGKNNPAFSFTEWSDVLFRGKALVENGAFSLTFTLPSSIGASVGSGKILFHAVANDGRQARGSQSSVTIGGTETDPPVSTQNPVVQAFINDSTFVDGGITTPDALLLIGASDDFGINLSIANPQLMPTAVLDGTETFQLADYFVANAGDPTKGVFQYPMVNLAPGAHDILVRVSDIHGNTSQTMIRFYVTESEDLKIEVFGNYPNPVADETTFFFRHNRAGDDLQTEIEVFKPTGEVVFRSKADVISSNYEVSLYKLSNTDTKKLDAGLYLARLVVRSLGNGSKNEFVTKLIILN